MYKSVLFLLVKTVYMFKHCISEVKNLMFMLKEKLICGVVKRVTSSPGLLHMNAL